MRLTDTLAEQQVLEDLLERSKPAVPPEFAGFDYLIYTPFRYAPYPTGSRFRRAGQPEGVFYGSERPGTAIAEIGFYRLLFFAEAPDAVLPSAPVEHTVFAVRCAADRCLALFEPPLDRSAVLWRHPTDYEPCQRLADAAREAGVQVIRYLSVRDPGGGRNAAILSAAAFADRRPRRQQTWHVFPGAASVRAWCEQPKQSLEFRREDFGNDPRLAGAVGAQ